MTARAPSQRRGFTLIELLVVMAIIAIAATLVGPLAFNQYESSKRTAEREQLLRLISEYTFFAYSRNQNFTLTTATTDFSIEKGQPSLAGGGTPQGGQPFLGEKGNGIKLMFEYLEFPEQRIYLNRHGFWQPNELRWYEGDNERSVQLNMQLIESGEEGDDARAD
ncbi:type II secretion system protein [Pseudidiomarina salilacus]|uniref:type II secretion system protein n=1 Tax=Pseudidiomarina salilacus TaxID=3384452 RepID=UPI0039848A88